MSKRITIVGGGPGGYVAGILASQLGAKVTLIEKNKLGGTCLNVGCIPTKALLHSVGLYSVLRAKGAEMGVLADNLRIDWGKAVGYKDGIVSYLVESVKYLLRSNGIEIIHGEGKITAPNKVEVLGQTIESDALIIATGSEPAHPPIPGLDAVKEFVVTSNEALSLASLPGTVSVVGGGVIGLEFASIFSSFGVNVTVLEMMPRVLSNIDAEIAAALRASLEKKGVTFYTDANISSINKNNGGLKLNITMPSKSLELSADKLFIAAGRRPFTQNLGLEALGIEMNDGRIQTDAHMETSLKNIYAIGDCTSKIQLAHVASREGEVAVKNIMGQKCQMDYRYVPSAIYTAPSVASVGLSEEEAGKQGIDIAVGRFPLMGNGKSIVAGDMNGMVKIVSEKNGGKILGIHIMGGPATDMIGEGTLALHFGAKVEDLINIIHAHPTVSEAIGEAAMQVFGSALHLPRR